MSLFLAALFLSLSFVLAIFSSVFLHLKQEEIYHQPDKLPNYSALFSDVNNKKPLAIYYYVIFFFRRMIFGFGLIAFYECAEVQITTWIITSFAVLYYLITVLPYKDRNLNFFTIFNEVCVFMVSVSLILYDNVKVDQNSKVVTGWKQDIGWLTIAPVIIWVIVNVIYLFPVKIYETFILAKLVVGKLKRSSFKVKNFDDTSKEVFHKESDLSIPANFETANKMRVVINTTIYLL